MIATLLIIAGVIFIPAFSVLIHSILFAPEGREDATGFHLVPDRALDRPRRHVAKPEHNCPSALVEDLHLPVT